MTQRELAERVGLAEQAIQRYEAGDCAGVGFAVEGNDGHRPGSCHLSTRTTVVSPRWLVSWRRHGGGDGDLVGAGP